MTQAFPSWPLGIPLSMHVYLTTNPHGNVFGGPELNTLPHFVWKNITFGDWSDSRTVEYEVKLPKVRELCSCGLICAMPILMAV